MTFSELHLKALEDENHRIQSQASAQALEILNLQAHALERLPSPESKREAVRYLKARYGASQRHLCKLLGLAQSLMHYKPHPPDDDEIRDRILELAAVHRDWGYRRILDKLRQEGIEINHKRAERLYRAENLKLKDMKGLAERKLLLRASILLFYLYAPCPIPKSPYIYRSSIPSSAVN